MTAEGWDGESIRQHVANARSDAAEGIDLARSALDEIQELKARLNELEGRFADEKADRATYAEVAPGLPPEVSARDAQRAGLFPKVRWIREEIGRWRHFLIEVRGVRAALREWAALEGPEGMRRDG